MKRGASYCLMIILLAPWPVFAQQDTVSGYKNSIKLNALGMAFSNVSLLYERRLNEHWAVQVGSSYRWGGGIPRTFGLGKVTVNSEFGGIKGHSFTPEVRYYFNLCDCGGAPSGLYTGLYGRYTKYYGDLSFEVWTGEEFLDVATGANLRELGLDPINIEPSADETVEVSYGFRYFRYAIGFGVLF